MPDYSFWGKQPYGQTAPFYPGQVDPAQPRPVPSQIPFGLPTMPLDATQGPLEGLPLRGLSPQELLEILVRLIGAQGNPASGQQMGGYGNGL